MIVIILLLLIIYVIGFIFSPFPYWKTYFTLWKYLLTSHSSVLNIRARIRQARFLAGYFFLCPLWTFLWYLDELLYPEYRKVQVKPVFIIGQPRSGTTFLHRTLADDRNNFVAVRHMEWRYPYISLQKLFHKFAFLKKSFQSSYWPDNTAGKLASKMHPNTLVDWEEDGIFFEECFLHHFFIFLRFPYPDLLDLN